MFNVECYKYFAPSGCRKIWTFLSHSKKFKKTHKNRVIRIRVSLKVKAGH